MAELEAEAKALAQLLADAEHDDSIDIIGAIDQAPEDVRRAAAAIQRQRIYEEAGDVGNV